MKATKKCPNCGKWSTWNQAPTDRCEHCQNLLDPKASARLQAQQERKAEEKERFTVDFIQIDPDDPLLTKFWKRIGLSFQIAFVALVSFFLWLIAFLAA